MAASTGVTIVPPRGLSIEVLVAGLLFATSAGLTGLASISPQEPPSALLLLGWPLFAVAGAVLLDRTPRLRLGRTLAALSLAPAAIVAASLLRFGQVEAEHLAAAAGDLAAPLGCAVALALPWAFNISTRTRSEERVWLASCGAAVAGSFVVVASSVAGWPAPVTAAGWGLAVAATLGCWTVAAVAVRRGERAARRRMAWLLATLAGGCLLVAGTWLLWPGTAGFYVTCAVLMVGSVAVANLWATTGFRPLDEHLLDLCLVLGVAATATAVAGLVHLGSVVAHRPSNTTTAVFTALLTAAMTAPLAVAVRRNAMARRYGSGLIAPHDVATITADLHARTEPRDLLEKAARMVAAASGSAEVRIVLGDDGADADDAPVPGQWMMHPLEVGGDRVGTLLVASPDPDGPEARQQHAVAQLLPTVALVARAVGLAVEAEHARQDVARERDTERTRVLGDLHDGLGPVLAGMSMRVQAARRTATSPEQAALLSDLAADLATSRTELRRIVVGITPSTLDDGNLEAALQALVGSFQTTTGTPTVGLTVHLETTVTPAVQVAVYRSVAEGITNGLRHSSAEAIDVDVRASHGRVVAVVTDNGVGGPVVPGVGLSSLARRAETLGGQLTVCPGNPGTRLRLVLPTSGVAGTAGAAS